MENTVFSEGLARYFSHEQRQKLAHAHIGIAGAGGLGSNCAMMLARCGVGHFVLVDHDVVDASNLNRQHFFPRHVGMPKVQALAEQMLDLNEEISVVTVTNELNAHNVHEIFAPCSIIVEAVDLASTKAVIIQELISCGKNVVAASGMAGWGGPCMTKKVMGSRLVVVGDFVTEVGTARESSDYSETDCHEKATLILPPLAPRVIMAASMQADAVLSLLLGPCPSLNG